MAVAFFIMLKSWLGSVKTLSMFSNCSMTHVEHTLDEGEDVTGHDQCEHGPGSPPLLSVHALQ